MADRTERFARFLQRWWDQQLHGGTYPDDWRHGRDEVMLAAELRRTAEFELVQAAFLHRRPSEDEARAVVDRLVPAPIESDAALLVGAVVRAGATARKVRATTVAGGLVTVAALVVRNILRGR
jgi:hypothetical protein